MILLTIIAVIWLAYCVYGAWWQFTKKSREANEKAEGVRR